MPQPSPLTEGFDAASLYFAEQPPADRTMLQCGLDGPFVHQGKTLLTAANVDWSLFNGSPEYAKCAAVVLYEHLIKPSGAALVRMRQGNGTVLVCSVDYRVASPAADAFWRRLLGNLGVHLGSTQAAGPAPRTAHDLLLDGPLN